MGDVVDILEHKPHATGPARCMSCLVEWVAVAPTGTRWLECPTCKLVRGRFIHAHERTDKPHWHCTCGNDLFLIVEQGVYCPNCGLWTHPWGKGPARA